MAASHRIPLLPALLLLGALAPTESPAREALPAPGRPTASPSNATSLPDVYGPGAVLRQGRLRMKITNWGILGNPFTNLSSDPSATWPGASGVEYLNSILLAVGAKDASAPVATAHRVSYATEWSSLTASPEDRIYRTWETAPHGLRQVNDDNDYDPVEGLPRVDEDFLDGRDNDGDGLIDEDFGAFGHETYTCLMRDDGAYSQSLGGGVHVPLSIECRQMAWDYIFDGFNDFVAVEYTVFNRSGQLLDSVFVGFKMDMDVGPTSVSNYFLDDRDLPGYPSGDFVRVVNANDPRRQFPHAYVPEVSVDSALCPRVLSRLNGFSVADNDGDGGQTPGVASFLLLDHTIDPLGVTAPARVGFRAFRSFTAGTPFAQGGNPSDDSLRYVFMSGNEGVDPATGFIDAPPGALAGDYVQWCSVGPFLQWRDGGEIHVTVAFAIQAEPLVSALQYAADYAAYRAGSLTPGALLAAHAPARNALTIETVRDGIYERRFLDPLTTFHGRETALREPRGSPGRFASDCRNDGTPRLVTDHDYTWFDFDCDYCTGPWDS